MGINKTINRHWRDWAAIVYLFICFIDFFVAPLMWNIGMAMESDEIKKRKLARHPVNATDDYKMKKGKPDFKFPSPTGEMVIHVWLRPMAKPASKDTKAFNYQLEDK